MTTDDLCCRYLLRDTNEYIVKDLVHLPKLDILPSGGNMDVFREMALLVRDFSLLVHNDPVEAEVSAKCQQTQRSMHDVRILRRQFVPFTSLLRCTIPCLREWTPARFLTTQ